MRAQSHWKEEAQLARKRDGEIVKLLGIGTITQADIARLYGVSRARIGQIVKRLKAQGKLGDQE